MNKIPIYYDGWAWSFHRPDTCTEKEYIDKHLIDLNKKRRTDINQLTPMLFNTYDNVNLFIERTKPYNPKGRLGGENNAREADEGIRKLLTDGGYQFISLPDGDKIVANILYMSGVTI